MFRWRFRPHKRVERTGREHPGLDDADQIGDHHETSARRRSAMRVVVGRIDVDVADAAIFNMVGVMRVAMEMGVGMGVGMGVRVRVHVPVARVVSVATTLVVHRHVPASFALPDRNAQFKPTQRPRPCLRQDEHEHECSYEDGGEDAGDVRTHGPWGYRRARSYPLKPNSAATTSCGRYPSDPVGSGQFRAGLAGSSGKPGNHEGLRGIRGS